MKIKDYISDESRTITNSVDDNPNIGSNSLTESLVQSSSKSLHETNWRYLALMLMCLLTFGRYFAYDNPQALETVLEADLNIDSFQYSLLYSVYSIPNIFLPFIGGVVVDYLGVRIGIFFFSIMIVMGQTLVCVGGYLQSYVIMIMGRILFGLGGENIGVVQSKIICKWFKNDKVAFAISLSTALSRAGSASNSFITPKLYNGELGFPFLVSDFLCCFSLLCGLIVSYIDLKSDKMQGLSNSTGKEVSEKIRLSDIKSFGKLYWVLILNCMAMYGSVNGFLNVGNDYIQTRFGFTETQAGNFLTVYYGISMFFTPVFGFIADKFGNRSLLILSSNILLVIGQLILIILPDCIGCYTVLIPIVLMGFFISIYAATFWGCIPVVVEKRALGTAFGLTYSMQNFSWALLPLAISGLQNIGYIWVSIFVCSIASFGTLVAVAIGIIDKKGEQNLKRVFKNE